MRSLPSGTVTFLFTDIEGSTKLLQQHGDRYADLLAEHRRILRNAFSGRAGVEVDTQGDAFFVAFERASDGVLAAQHAQTELAAGPTVALAGGGLATSSTTVRRWRSGAVELHHLVDPRTGRPAESPWRTVSVAAKTCVDANVASTASFLLEDAPRWLEDHRLPARLVSIGGESTVVAGWPEDGT